MRFGLFDSRWLPIPRTLRVVLFVYCCAAASLLVVAQPDAPARWWKGNLHTHSLWSDGDDYPEMIADWYKRHGYHFLALSDHNVLSQGQQWIPARNNRGGGEALDKYRERFGRAWVQERIKEGEPQVRLKPLSEFRHLFEEPNRFLMIQSEEITDRFERKPVHLNATNLREFIAPQGGASVLEVMQNNVSAVLEQRRRTGQPMFPHLNHPNFGWAITAEELMHVQEERFFEVYNGHPAVHNEGDEAHPGTERMWDIILAFRIAHLGLEPIFGIAVDDSHNYHAESSNRSNPGRGWVTVRAPFLTPEHIVDAMEAGRFYASSGVRLEEVRRDKTGLALRIDAEEGVTYTTSFIGTRRGFDATSAPRVGPDGKTLPVTRRYSADIGEVLAEVKGTNPVYRIQGDEIYVRAKVVSSKPKENPSATGEVESAWTQPLIVEGDNDNDGNNQ